MTAALPLSRRFLALAVSLILLTALSTSAGAAETGSRAEGPRCPSGTERTHGLCVSPTPRAQEAAAVVRTAFRNHDLGAVIAGVWRKDEPVLVGALGESLPGVPATRNMHHITGNMTASMLTTVFLQLVDEGKLALDDKLSNWFPTMPSADSITLEMLTHSTTGYAHFPADENFQKALYANPFRSWNPARLVRFALSEPLAFPPGTGWQFADTNLLILQMVIEKTTHRPMGKLLQNRVFDPLGLKNTTPAEPGALLEPVLHGYTAERGVWEDATFWNPEWIQYAGGVGSNQADLRRFIEAVGSGELLSPKSHEAQLAPTTVGLNPLMTKQFYYAMGIGVTKGWIFANPSLPGYTAAIAHLPKKDLTIVIYSTRTKVADQEERESSQLFVQLATLLAPKHVPLLPGG